MERVIFDRLAENDTKHWWYRARRRVLGALIARRITLPANAQLLEIGCGTGYNLPMLAGFGAVDATEMDEAARAVASERLGQPVKNASLPDLNDVPSGHYDLIALLDVLEHVEDDRAALISIAERLTPTGTLLLTVPAHQWLWGANDVAGHHFRRYSSASFRKVMVEAGLTVRFQSPFNSLLFPIAIAWRLLGRLMGREESDEKLPPAPVNKLFDLIFGWEAQLLGRLPMPPGLSFVAIASRV